jgi:4-hydroxy-tetrahydrodipicolinate reductase
MGVRALMARIGILGIRGRMGQAVEAAAAEAGASIAGGIDRGGYALNEHKDAEALARACDVLIDFSALVGVRGHVEAATAAGTPILIGTTGLGAEEHEAIDVAAQHIAVLQTANTSLGVNLLAHLVEEAARRLGPDWDVEIVEMHHRHKLDAPSGTALLLGAAANRGRGALEGTALNRFDRTGAREAGGIYYASLRGGSVAGDHMVVLAGEGERIELGHRAESREIFARGAVRAAAWLIGKPAGRYTMADVLGLD